MSDRSTPLVRLAGPERGASCGLVLLHGRGADAAGMRPLADAVAAPDLAVLAPDAPHHSWYPDRFLVPRERNQPWLDQALEAVGSAVARLADEGVPGARVTIAGFSQGACLALEFAARHPGRYAAVVAFAGALVGPDPATGGYEGDFDGTPILMASGTADAHVPVDFVERSAAVLRAMGADVRLVLRQGMGHGIHPEDMAAFAHLVRASGA